MIQIELFPSFPLHQSEVGGTAIPIDNSQPWVGTVKVFGAQVYIRRVAPFTNGQTVSVSVPKEAFKDLAGNIMNADFTFSFTVNNPSWTSVLASNATSLEVTAGTQLPPMKDMGAVMFKGSAYLFGGMKFICHLLCF